MSKSEKRGVLLGQTWARPDSNSPLVTSRKSVRRNFLKWMVVSSTSFSRWDVGYNLIYPIPCSTNQLGDTATLTESLDRLSCSYQDRKDKPGRKLDPKEILIQVMCYCAHQTPSIGWIRGAWWTKVKKILFFLLFNQSISDEWNQWKIVWSVIVVAEQNLSLRIHLSTNFVEQSLFLQAWAELGPGNDGEAGLRQYSLFPIMDFTDVRIQQGSVQATPIGGCCNKYWAENQFCYRVNASTLQTAGSQAWLTWRKSMTLLSSRSGDDRNGSKPYTEEHYPRNWLQGITKSN